MIIDWLYGETSSLIASFKSEPPDIGVAMLIAFFVVGVLCSIGNPYNLGLRFIAQWTIANVIVRYLGSYLTYDKPLREGLWPVLWNFAGILGIYLVWRKRGGK